MARHSSLGMYKHCITCLASLVKDEFDRLKLSKLKLGERKEFQAELKSLESYLDDSVF